MTIRDTLHQIESQARWTRHHALETISRVRLLAARRSFDTNARAEIEEAERALTDALSKVQAAKAEYDCKPVNDKAA